MSLRNTAEGWGLPARALHWIMAALIVFMLGLGFYMASLPTDMESLPLKFELTQLHKSWGFVAFALVLLRVLWRLASPAAPRPPAGMSALERLGAKAGHLALYVLMFAMPLTGWLMASASTLQEQFGVKNMVFGWFELPDPFAPGDADLAATLRTVHELGAFALLAVLAVHVGAALRHHFVLRDNVLTRMVTGR